MKPNLAIYGMRKVFIGNIESQTCSRKFCPSNGWATEQLNEKKNKRTALSGHTVADDLVNPNRNKRTEMDDGNR